MSISDIMISPIGIITTPYADFDEKVPIQGKLKPDVEGRIEIYPEYKEGLKDLDGFSHLYILYLFHRSDRIKLNPVPYMDTEERGVFSTRSPHRPNHIGLTVVRLADIKDNIVTVRGVDMLDGTPVLDIKPYSNYFDTHENIRTGWMEKYVKEGECSANTTVDSEKRWLHE